MKVSTKGRYGLRALVDLAYNAKEEAVSLVSVAQRQNISLDYLEQVFSSLRKAGILKSMKGSQGGYMLALAPEELTVSSILEVLEGRFCIADHGAAEGDTDSIQTAIQELVWSQIDKKVNYFLSSVTLADLVEKYEELNADQGGMYYI